MNKTSIESLLRIVRFIVESEIRQNKLRNKEKNKILNILFFISGVFPFLFAICLALINNFYFNNDIVKIISLVILCIGYLGIFSKPFVEIWLFRNEIGKSLKNPLSILLETAQEKSNIDIKALHYFSKKSIESLRFLQLELSSEKEAFLKRMALVSGAIEKIGLLPGLLALIVTIFKFGDDQPQWVYAIAYATPILYFISVIMHTQILKIERIIGLIEEAIQLKTQS